MPKRTRGRNHLQSRQHPASSGDTFGLPRSLYDQVCRAGKSMGASPHDVLLLAARLVIRAAEAGSKPGDLVKLEVGDPAALTLYPPAGLLQEVRAASARLGPDVTMTDALTPLLWAFVEWVNAGFTRDDFEQLRSKGLVKGAVSLSYQARFRGTRGAALRKRLADAQLERWAEEGQAARKAAGERLKRARSRKSKGTKS